MEDQQPRNVWGAVDKSGDPAGYVRFLDATRAESSRAIEANPDRIFGAWGIQEGFQILDVGCGTGDLIWPAAKLVGSTGRVVGVDYSETMIEAARQRNADRGLPLEFQTGDAHHLDFADNTFDVCSATFVFMHLEDPAQALREMVRVAKPGGLITVLDNDWETNLIAATDKALTRKMLNFYADNIRHGWIGRDLLGLFNAAGLQKVEVFPYARRHERPLDSPYLGPRAVMHRALAGGVITQAEADAWLQDQEQRVQNGSYFQSVTMFRAVGRKAETDTRN